MRMLGCWLGAGAGSPAVCQLPPHLPGAGHPALLLDRLQLVFQLLLPKSFYEEEGQADEGFPQGHVHAAAHGLVRGTGAVSEKRGTYSGNFTGSFVLPWERGQLGSLAAANRRGQTPAGPPSGKRGSRERTPLQEASSERREPRSRSGPGTRRPSREVPTSLCSPPGLPIQTRLTPSR